MTKPDPSLLVDAVPPKVLRALALASEALTAANVRHIVVVGLAVGANGYPRDVKTCRAYLAAHAPTFVAAFDECVIQAEAEQD